MRSVPRPVVLLVVLHTALLACYTLPEAWVPARARTFATAYSRGLFHQQWQLFAPDPPLCSCHLEWRNAEGTWTDPLPNTAHYLERRMLRSAAWNVQRERNAGQDLPSVPVQQALRNLATQYATAASELRLVERCVTDPGHADQRVLRVTPLTVP